MSHPGDASLYPTGVVPYRQTVTPGWRAEFAFRTQHRSGLDPIALTGRDKAVHRVTEWIENGRRMVAYDDTDRAGSRCTAKIFRFPGYELIEAHLPAGDAAAAYGDGRPAAAYRQRPAARRQRHGEGRRRRGRQGTRGRRPAFAREALEDSVVVDVEASVSPG